MNTKLKINKDNNKFNKKEFKIHLFYGTYFCVLCGKQVDLYNSYSNQGDRLICSKCTYDKFGSVYNAKRWIDNE